MKVRLFFYGVLIILLPACMPVRDFGQEIAIEYIDKGITIKPNKTVENEIGSFKIIYSQGLLIYEVNSINYKVVKSTKVGKDINNEVVPTSDTTFKYFVLKSKDNFGFMYDSLSMSCIGKKFHLDSLLNQLGINVENMKIFSLNLGKPTSKENIGKFKTLEKYFTKTNAEDADSIYRYFDGELKNVNFSFAPQLDKSRNSKLYKTQLIYLPTDSNKSRQELISEIKRVKLKNFKNISILIERFEKDYL